MKKKMILLFLLCALITGMNIGLAHGADYGMAIVDGQSSDKVHLRERPSVESKSLGLFFTGTEVLCQSSSNQEWVMVTIGSQSGYMKTEFLFTGTGPNSVISRQPTGIVNNRKGSTWVNLRSDPSLDAQVASTLNNGTVLTILGETDTHWYYVNVGNQYGYMKSDYVELTGSVSSGYPIGRSAAPSIVNAKISVDYYPVNRKYSTKAGNYLELDLMLPKLSGSYGGIPAINDFFAGKEQVFYGDLSFETLEQAETNGQSIRGKESGYFRSAYYTLTATLGDIVSFSAELNGGAGGVDWAGIEGNTFDLNTGKRLTLSDIFNTSYENYMGVILDIVSRKIAGEISAAKKNGYGSPYNFDDAYSGQGYESIRTLGAEDFYLTPNTLVVYYPKYTLSVGAAGPQVFEIPFASIQDILGI